MYRARILDLHPVGVAPSLVFVLRLLAFVEGLGRILSGDSRFVVVARLYIGDLKYEFANKFKERIHKGTNYENNPKRSPP